MNDLSNSSGPRIPGPASAPPGSRTTTRRSVLLGSLLAGAALSLPDWELLAAMHHHGETDTPPAGPSMLSAEDRADLVAITAQIIPTDATPGAREAGAADFIDRVLTSILAPLAEDFRAGLRDFQHGVTTRFAGRTFATLTDAQQIEWLQSVEHSSFFAFVRQLTVLGMFSDPSYGGNQHGIGWKLLGFVDQHAFVPPFGYYDRDYPGFQLPVPFT